MLEPKVQSFSHCQNTSNVQYTEDGYAYRESNNGVFASLISRGKLLKGSICSCNG